MENIMVNFTPGKGRKRLQNVENWKRNKLKMSRHKSKSLPKMPQCSHKKKVLRCSTLIMQDIRRFHQAFYNTANKIDQDNFILKHTQQHRPHRNRPVKGNRDGNKITVTYFINTKQNGMVQVCANAFASIIGVSKFRIQNICKKFLATGHTPREERGGDRRSQKYATKRESVRAFISNLQCVESHYTREKSMRQYMPSDCTIRKLWRAYCDVSEAVKYHYFREIFVRDFNISFRSPATDVCSECIRLKGLITATHNNNKKPELIAKMRVHKLKAKAFYELLRHEEENILKLSFDCQKNMVLPRVPDQRAYYSRQLYLYNFTICQGHSKAHQTRESTFVYTWCENERKKGANEIASMLYHRLCNTNLENITSIKLFADGCPGQNKNSVIIGMLAKWLNSTDSNVNLIQITFPVVGHSYLPPDRIFGRIEKIIKKKHTIVKPEEYKEIFGMYGTVFELGKDFSVYDWKTSVQLVIKSPAQLHFQISTCKRILIQKTKSGDIKVQGEINYRSDIGVYKSILKRGKSLNLLTPLILPNEVQVKQLKLTDVDMLLKTHFEDSWRSEEDLTFYKNIIDNASATDDSDRESDQEVVEDFIFEDLRI